MNIFGFNINDLSWAALPQWLRRHESVYALLVALISPIKSLMLVFEQKQATVNFQIRYGNQVIYMERGLNDKFNAGHNGIFDALNGNIYIEDGTFFAEKFNFLEYEWTEFDAFEALELETVASNYELVGQETVEIVHYIIYVPTAIGANLIELEGFVRKYNPVGKNFDIQTY